MIKMCFSDNSNNNINVDTFKQIMQTAFVGNGSQSCMLTGCVYLVRSTNEAVVGTSLLDDVADEMFLSVVCRQYGDLVGRVADHTHVHVHRHHVLCFSQVLHSTAADRRLSAPVKKVKVAHTR